MYTLQGTDKNPVQIEMENNIRRCFVADGALTKGAIVKLQADGTVAACSDGMELPIGHVLVPAADEGQVTVSLAARAIVRGRADGPITCGQMLCIDADGYVATGSKGFVVGLALNSAADAASVEVALLYSPFAYTGM